MGPVQFWFDGEQFVLDADLWGEFEERYSPTDDSAANRAAAERIVREIADPAGGKR